MFCVVVDINGVLVKRIWSRSKKQSNERDNVLPMESKNGAQHVYIRPYALTLLEHLLKNDEVELVLWSSMTEEYMRPIVDLLLTHVGYTGEKVVKTLNQSDCTPLPHPTHKYKPLFAKDVKKIYELLPNIDGVIFIDDSSDKMIFNEDETIIIAKPWEDHNNIDDSEIHFNVMNQLDAALF